MFENKFDMTQEENVWYAKRLVVDSIWKEARLEGINVTFPDTAEIFEGRTVSGLSVNETIAINNLKHAWEYCLQEIEVPLDFRMLKEFNQLIGEAGVTREPGKVRTVDVRIGGTTWRPDIPNEQMDKEGFESMLRGPEGPEKGLDIMCWVCRKQLFFDGNKRTAQLAANHYLISQGFGILAIAENKLSRFRKALTDFYETNEPTPLKLFLYEDCLVGTDFSKERTGQKINEDKSKPAVPHLGPRKMDDIVAGATRASAAQAGRDFQGQNRNPQRGVGREDDV
ncbi:MAG: Fic family protein [Coriobacteriales bacterium]|jgi:hypothetical protein|nr:Fic family protein [Coriobacteriales bacterium]